MKVYDKRHSNVQTTHIIGLAMVQAAQHGVEVHTADTVIIDEAPEEHGWITVTFCTEDYTRWTVNGNQLFEAELQTQECR